MICIIIPSSHLIAAFPWVPGIHSHVIVLIGNVSRTLHIEFNPQGVDASQGLTHFLLIHPVCDGQSESLVHSLSTVEITFNKQIINKYLKQTFYFIQ